MYSPSVSIVQAVLHTPPDSCSYSLFHQFGQSIASHSHRLPHHFSLHMPKPTTKIIGGSAYLLVFCLHLTTKNVLTWVCWQLITAVEAAPQALMSDMLQQCRNPPSDIVNIGALTLAVLLKSSIKSRPPCSFILLFCCCKKKKCPFTDGTWHT